MDLLLGHMSQEADRLD